MGQEAKRCNRTGRRGNDQPQLSWHKIHTRHSLTHAITHNITTQSTVTDTLLTNDSLIQCKCNFRTFGSVLGTHFGWYRQHTHEGVAISHYQRNN